MASDAYQLKFPCPQCAGKLTMTVQQGEGHCPLCKSNIHVTLDVKVSEQQGNSKRGWENRAFRRPSDSKKPMWQAS